MLRRWTVTVRRSHCLTPGGHLWRDHFRLDGEIIQPLTPVGEVTARLLRLNTAERTIERRLLQDLDLYPRH